jgi:hypothetical protein
MCNGAKVIEMGELKRAMEQFGDIRRPDLDFVANHCALWHPIEKKSGR